jgi:MoaA/NifB/PqqE/SkfB family radical SAM enzyme
MDSGFDPSRFAHLLNGRRLYLWGASIVGTGCCRALERCGFTPAGFIDSSPRLHGKSTIGYPVSPPVEILNDPDARQKVFVIISSGHYENEIAELCRGYGLAENDDFISARTLSPLDPSVDISGLCNLRCISCPRGNYAEQPARGFMSAATYSRVIEKLLNELPFMGNLQLYSWGEPFLNPELAEIIAITIEKKVLCALSTNLNVKGDLTDVIRARPDWIKVSASGFGPSYELTHTGGNWEIFVRNLKQLKDLRENCHPGMYVEVNYHLYKHNIGNDYRRMAELCQELGFVFKPNWAYLYPLDTVLDYCEGRKLSTEAEQTLGMLLLGIDEGLDRARNQASLPCAEERCFPISWDLSVRSCGAWFWPTTSDNYLKEPLQDILERRARSGICELCRCHALHRFTSVYVEETSSATGTGDQSKGTNP